MSTRRRGLKDIIILLIVGATVAVGACFVLWYFNPFGLGNNKDDNSQKVEDERPEPVAVSANLKMLFAGTTFWGRRTNQLARASELGVSYPFSKLDTLNREEYDAWIGGLECPITDNGHNYTEEEEIFKFNCDPDYLSEAKKYFTAFMLGNNHTDNQDGGEGLTTTRKYLDDNEIQYFGTPKYSGNVASELARDTEEASNCGVVVLPMNVTYDDGETREIKMPFGFCSAHGVFGIPGDDYIENMKTYATYLPTIVMPHMGAEYQPAHDELRQTLYRQMVDYAGVDSVIADHPHWVQDAEGYHGRLIAYSIGNFMFDQRGGVETSRSAAIEGDAEVADASSVDFDEWDMLGEACLADKDTCFEQIKIANLPKVNLNWKYDFHATTSEGDCITRLSSPAEQSAVAERLHWAAIPEELKK